VEVTASTPSAALSASVLKVMNLYLTAADAKVCRIIIDFSLLSGLSHDNVDSAYDLFFTCQSIVNKFCGFVSEHFATQSGWLTVIFSVCVSKHYSSTR